AFDIVCYLADLFKLQSLHEKDKFPSTYRMAHTFDKMPSRFLNSLPDNSFDIHRLFWPFRKWLALMESKFPLEYDNNGAAHNLRAFAHLGNNFAPLLDIYLSP